MGTDKSKVAAILVAFNRDNLLVRALDCSTNQTRSADAVIVVDNANLDSTKLLVESRGAIYLSGSVDNGSAGGFAIGIDFALKHNFDYIWTLDDDGYPEKDCLKVLLNFASKNKYDVVSPLSLAQENHLQTANPYLFGVRKRVSVKYIQKKETWKNKVQFYNGMLMSMSVVQLIGLPKKELFLRGDEMDYFYRAKSAGVSMGLVTRALFYHPSGDPEFGNSRTSFLGVVTPVALNKRYYQYRNRGFLIREHKLFLNAIYDWIRYPVFFLIYPGRNLNGFLTWSELWLMGFKRNLKPFSAIPPNPNLLRKRKI